MVLHSSNSPSDLERELIKKHVKQSGQRRGQPAWEMGIIREHLDGLNEEFQNFQVRDIAMQFLEEKMS